MKLYVVRHGESAGEIEGCYGGIADFPLTDKGQEQARALAKQLYNANLQAILTSPLARAHETARIIAEELGNGLEVTIIEDLQERNSYGVLSGVNKARAAQIFRHVLKDLRERPEYSREPLAGAEDFDVFVQRVHRAFKEVIKFAQDGQLDRLAVVSHGKFAQVLLENVINAKGEFRFNLGAINVVNYQPEVAAVDILNPEA